MAYHFPIGGSTAARVTQCPGSVLFIKNNNLKSSTNQASKEGTRLHSVMEEAIKIVNPLSPISYSLLEAYLPTLDEKDKAVINQSFVDLLQTFKIYKFTNFETEKMLRKSEIAGGSADVVAWSKTHYAIIDYKFGKTPVSSHKNKQLLFYHYCSRPLLKNLNFAGVIIQPRVKYSAYDFTKEDVKEFSELIESAIIDAQSDNPTFRKGHECFYCPASGLCPETKPVPLTISEKAKTFFARKL